MSFAIIKTGGKQYKVRAGEILKVERLDEKSTSPKIEFIKNQLAKGQPTIPSTLEEELKTNIFLRSKNVENFSKLRDLKDNF